MTGQSRSGGSTARFRLCSLRIGQPHTATWHAANGSMLPLNCSMTWPWMCSSRPPLRRGTSAAGLQTSCLRSANTPTRLSPTAIGSAASPLRFKWWRAGRACRALGGDHRRRKCRPRRRKIERCGRPRTKARHHDPTCAFRNPLGPPGFSNGVRGGRQPRWTARADFFSAAEIFVIRNFAAPGKKIGARRRLERAGTHRNQASLSPPNGGTPGRFSFFAGQ